jgi:hypothetical protein
MKNIFVLAVVLSALIACNNSGTEETTTSTAEENPASNNELQENNTDPFATSGDVATGTSASGKLNPPHGEPGHRCEIAVGAPLDSEPTSPSSTTINNTSVTPNLNTSGMPSISGNAQDQVKAVTAPGMNPPHGEPGHDCAIPVGAPLKK